MLLQTFLSFAIRYYWRLLFMILYCWYRAALGPALAVHRMLVTGAEYEPYSMRVDEVLVRTSSPRLAEHFVVKADADVWWHTRARTHAFVVSYQLRYSRASPVLSKWRPPVFVSLH